MKPTFKIALKIALEASWRFWVSVGAISGIFSYADMRELELDEFFGVVFVFLLIWSVVYAMMEDK